MTQEARKKRAKKYNKLQYEEHNKALKFRKRHIYEICQNSG